MRAAGLLLSIVCLLASIVILWLGYIVTFESSGLSAQFESTPREGWDYWIQKEFWRDVRWFSLYAVLALGGFLLPLFASLFGRQGAHMSRPLSWALFVLATLYTGAWSIGVVQWLRRGDFHPILLIPVVMLFGSVFAMSAFLARVRRQTSILPDESQQNTTVA